MEYPLSNSAPTAENDSPYLTNVVIGKSGLSGSGTFTNTLYDLDDTPVGKFTGTATVERIDVTMGK